MSDSKKKQDKKLKTRKEMDEYKQRMRTEKQQTLKEDKKICNEGKQG